MLLFSLVSGAVDSLLSRQLGDNVIWVTAILTGVGACYVGLKRVVKGIAKIYRRFTALVDLAEHELNHNSGSSTKDFAQAGKLAANKAVEAAEKAGNAAEAVGEEVKRLGERFETYVATNSAEQRATWSAIEVLTRMNVSNSVELPKKQIPEGSSDGNSEASAPAA